MVKRKKKLKLMSIVVFEPGYAKKNPKAYKGHPLELGEQALYLGDIPNAPGHCAVAKHSGEVIWLVHPDEFRMATDDEV